MDAPDGPPGDPLYLRWENTNPPHRKFCEVEIELSLFYPKLLVRRWGRIGTPRARSLRQVLADAEAVRRLVEELDRRRMRHGYRCVAAVRVPLIQAEAA
jgi:predicted DNA-binding WGR domain protein